MRYTVYLAVMMALLLARDATAAERIRLSWTDATKAISGKKVTVILPDNAAVTGRVTGVEPDSLVLQPNKLIPRRDVTMVRLTRHGFAWQITGATGGFFLGGFTGYQAGVRTFGDNSGSKGLSLALVVMAGVTALGYLIGRQADRKTVLIEIIQEQSNEDE